MELIIKLFSKAEDILTGQNIVVPSKDWIMGSFPQHTES